MEGSTAKLPLIGQRLSPPRSAKPIWLTDTADLFVLLCSFSLTTISIVYLSILFHQLAMVPFWAYTPNGVVSFLPRIISSLSLTVTSAVIVVAGKRYVLFKLANGGMRTQRVAVYSSPTITNLASHLTLHGTELPLFGLVAVWVLALVTGLTVNNSWRTGSASSYLITSVPSGPLDVTSNQSWVTPAIGQLTFIMSSSCLDLTDVVNLIDVVDPNAGEGSGRLSMGTIFFPPFNMPDQFLPNGSFSATTTFNGFNITIEQLTSTPSTAQELCTQDTLQLLYDWSDNQTLSLVAADGPTFRINATAIIMGGMLSFDGSFMMFALNGTSWPNVMSTGNQWAKDLANVICNATLPSIMGNCLSSQTDLSFLEFASLLNDNRHDASLSDEVGSYQYWSSVLNMAIGAYSSAVLLSENSPYFATGGPTMVEVSINQSGLGVKLAYGSYILCLNVVVSIAMIAVVLWLRLASPLGPDFLNPTRLLLDPLKKPELFNASLQTTVDALADPYMLVGLNNEFTLAERKVMREPAKRSRMLGMFSTRKRTRLDDYCEDSTMEMM